MRVRLASRLGAGGTPYSGWMRGQAPPLTPSAAQAILTRVVPDFRVASSTRSHITPPTCSASSHFALRHVENKRRAFIRGCGSLPRDWAPRVDLDRLHHAMEFWSWSASPGKLAVLADIRTDLEKIISNDAAQ